MTYTTRPSQHLSEAVEEGLENIPGSVLESLPLEVAATDLNCLSDRTDKDMVFGREYYPRTLKDLR
uniref:HalOD1 domain-containing protein n=1 Tax=Heterorhabditis bacteriophora TaxID=37862 RepID=A0A1I7WZ01_HETBA